MESNYIQYSTIRGYKLDRDGCLERVEAPRTKKYIEFPIPDDRHQKQVYAIRVDGKIVKKKVGLQKAIKHFKWMFYSNGSSRMQLINLSTNTVVMQRNGYSTIEFKPQI